jgi:regulator of replication initiation timing
MPFNVDINQAMILLGVRTLELEQIKQQAEALAGEYNKLKEENEELKKRLEEKEK